MNDFNISNAPPSPCKNCQNHSLDCRTECEEWAKFVFYTKLRREINRRHKLKNQTVDYSDSRRKRIRDCQKK